MDLAPGSVPDYSILTNNDVAGDQDLNYVLPNGLGREMVNMDLKYAPGFVPDSSVSPNIEVAGDQDIIGLIFQQTNMDLAPGSVPDSSVLPNIDVAGDQDLIQTGPSDGLGREMVNTDLKYAASWFY